METQLLKAMCPVLLLGLAATAFVQEKPEQVSPERARANFGLKHLDTFAWVGGFSSAPNTKPPAELVPDAAAAREHLKLLYLSCGNKDGLISISQGVHTYLKQQNIPHIWNVDDHGHDGETWGNNLHHFAQRIFVTNIQN
jgi:enterochelin esterase-like enzyme